MTVTPEQLGRLVPRGGWPEWVFTTPYRASAHPQATPVTHIAEGANCQRFAYEVLALFGAAVPPHRSSELWGDEQLDHVALSDVQDLDLVLFNRTDEARGAHVAVALADGFLHLSAEVAKPTVWQLSDFAARERYAVTIGAVRITRLSSSCR